MELFGVGPGLARANSHDIGQFGHEDFAVANLARVGRFRDRIQGRLEFAVIDNDFHFHLGHEVDRVLRAAIHLGMPLLPPEAPDLGNGHAVNALFDEGVLHVLQLEMPNDRFDLLHAVASLFVYNDYFLLPAPSSLPPAPCSHATSGTRLAWLVARASTNSKSPKRFKYRSNSPRTGSCVAKSTSRRSARRHTQRAKLN